MSNHLHLTDEETNLRISSHKRKQIPQFLYSGSGLLLYCKLRGPSGSILWESTCHYPCHTKWRAEFPTKSLWSAPQPMNIRVGLFQETVYFNSQMTQSSKHGQGLAWVIFFCKGKCKNKSRTVQKWILHPLKTHETVPEEMLMVPSLKPWIKSWFGSAFIITRILKKEQSSRALSGKQQREAARKTMQELVGWKL